MEGVYAKCPWTLLEGICIICIIANFKITRLQILWVKIDILVHVQVPCISAMYKFMHCNLKMGAILGMVKKEWVEIYYSV